MAKAIYSFQPEYAPEEIEDISRCLDCILGIAEGSCPMNRGLGVNWDILDGIPPDMENEAATDIMEKVDEYEPRVSVEEVSFRHNTEGEAVVTITLGKGDGSDG